MVTDAQDERPITIYTVAERAGVSIATVSRVLQGSGRVSPVTRNKVLRAVEELDYVPLRAGRPLDLPRHETHGLILPGLAGPYYSELLTGFESAAAQYGQSVVVVLGGGPMGLESSMRKLLPRVDGLVIANNTVSDAVVRSICGHTPTVLIARSPVDGCDTVLVENYRSAADLTAHLLDHGRRRLAFAGDPSDSHDVDQRYRGFIHALTQRGLTETMPPIRTSFEESSAPTVLDALIRADPQVDGLICANDELAISTMALLAREGLRVPEDVAIVGFDDIMTSRFVAPGMTTVEQPTRALGRWAAIRLHERIEGRTRDVQPQVIPTRMVVRGSCGCPWGGRGLPPAT